MTPIHLYSALPFQKKFFFKKRIVLYRYDNDDTAIALNEWGRNKYLNYIIGIPLMTMIIVISVIILPFFLLMKRINKERAEELAEPFFNFVEKLREDEHPDHQVKPFETNQDYVNTFKNKKPNKKKLRVLYLQEKDVEQLYGINKRRFRKYIDEIWLYNDIQEIYDKAIALGSDIDNSTIQLGQDLKNIIPLNLKVKEIKIALETNRKAIYKAKKMKEGVPPRIRLAPNDILPPTVILYVESHFHPEMNAYLTTHFTEINTKLQDKGYRLIYLPMALGLANNELDNYTLYNYPNLESGFVNELNETVFSQSNIADIAKGLSDALAYPKDMPSSCFIRCVHEGYFDKNESYEYSVFSLALEGDEIVSDKIDFYISVVGRNIKDDEVYFQLGSTDDADPDDSFIKFGNKLSPEIKANIDAITELNDDKILLSSMVYIIRTLKESQPELCKKLNQTLYNAIQNQNNTISKLVIDNQYRIFLPDYNNLEIEMGPLPKTVFLFLLNHPEGVLFKELRPHVNELVDIYAKVGNRIDMDQIRESILELTDPRSNSINEKCSRIKEAFISKITEELAENYFVTGNRSTPKGIKIDRSLVQFLQTK